MQWTTVITITTFLVSLAYAITEQNGDANNFMKSNRAYRNVADNEKKCFENLQLPKPDFKAVSKSVSELKCHELMHTKLMLRVQEINNENCHINEVNATEEPFKEWVPHMAAIGWTSKPGAVEREIGYYKHWVFKCVASLVSYSFVITSSQCISLYYDDVIENEPVVVKIGISQNNTESFPRYIPIKRIAHMPDDEPSMMHFDVALVELNETLQYYRTVHPACVTHTESISKYLHLITTSSWGVPKEGYIPSSVTTKKIVLLEDPQSCDNVLKMASSRRDLWQDKQLHQICGYYSITEGLNSEFHDCSIMIYPGSPVQIKIDTYSPDGKYIMSINYLLGVKSFNNKCDSAPIVYTPVYTPKVNKWIEHIIWPNEEF